MFRIEDGEAKVGGDVIKRVEVGKRTAVVTYFNKTAQAVERSHRFRLIDAYGIEIASFSTGYGPLGPGEAGALSTQIEITRADELLHFSTIALPADWATPVYVVIEDLSRPEIRPALPGRSR